MVIPTYNASAFIIETIESVLGQKENSFEIIIIDDGSEDNTCKLIGGVKDKRIKLTELEHTGNIGKNLNYGIQKTQYDLICILGADDIWEPEKMGMQIKYLNDYNFVCTNASIINKNGMITQEKFINHIKGDKDVTTCDLLENNIVIASSIIGIREKFLKYGGFDEKDGKKAEDYTLWLKVSENEKIKFINKNLIKYRIHGNNISFRNTTYRMNLLLKTYNIRKEYLHNSNAEEIRHCAQKGMNSLLNELYYISYSNGMLYRSKVFLKKRIELQTARFSLEYFKLFLKLVLINLKYLLRRIKKLKN